jgi:hypothetical protein
MVCYNREIGVLCSATKKLGCYFTVILGLSNLPVLEDHQFPELPQIDNDMFSKQNDRFGIAKAAYIEDMKDYKKKLSTYNDNKPKVYAIIWGQCTNAMHHKIREDKEFATFDAAKDPLLLWGRIQEILLTGAGQFQNEIKLKLEAKRDFDRMRQYKNESVGDFYQRYLVEQQALVASDIELPDPEEQAIDFINKLDVMRFASLLADLENASQAGRDEYPKNVNEAMTRAVNYKVVLSRYNGNDNSAVVYTTTADNSNKNHFKSKDDKTYKKNNTPSEESKKSSDIDKKITFHKNITCYLCGKKGHYKSDCPDLQADEENDEQANVVFTFLNENVLYNSKIGQMMF